MNIPNEVTEAAADWYDQLNGDVDEHTREAFVDWLATSPTHVAEFLRLNTVRHQLTGFATRNPELMESLRQQRSNIIDLDVQKPETVVEENQKNRFALWQYAAAVVVACACILWLAVDNSPQVLETAVGEQRHVLLADGSTIQLNTASRVEVNLTTDFRDIHLLQGEAMFTVVKDPKRPFRVYSDDVLVKAIGTRFSVYRHARETIVTVVEGRVSIDHPLDRELSPQEQPMNIELGSGERAFVAADKIHREGLETNLGDKHERS